MEIESMAPATAARADADARVRSDDQRARRWKDKVRLELAETEGRVASALAALEVRAARDSKPWALAANLMLDTGSRVGELLDAEWSEFDLDANVWRMPASRAKERRPRMTQLSQQAAQVLRALRARCAPGESRVFPDPSSCSMFEMAIRLAAASGGIDRFHAHEIKGLARMRCEQAHSRDADGDPLAA